MPVNPELQKFLYGKEPPKPNPKACDLKCGQYYKSDDQLSEEYKTPPERAKEILEFLKECGINAKCVKIDTYLKDGK